MTPRPALKSPAPVTFLLGEDYYAKQQYLNSLQQEYAPGGDFSREYLIADDVSPAAILDAARTPSLDLFASLATGPSRRLVIVDQGENISAPDWKLMKDYFESPDPATLLVFLIDKPKKKWSPAQWVPSGGILEFRFLRGAQLTRWLEEEAKARGLSFSRSGIQMLLQMMGEDRFTLVGELDKLTVSFPLGKQIDEDDVLEVAGQSKEVNVFLLAEQVFDGKTELALRSIDFLVGRGESPIGLLAVLVRHFRRLALASEALQRGAGEAEACRLAGVYWYKEKFLQQARNIKPAQIRMGYRALKQADGGMKSGGGSPRLELERVAIKLSRAPGENRRAPG